MKRIFFLFAVLSVLLISCTTQNETTDKNSAADMQTNTQDSKQTPSEGLSGDWKEFADYMDKNLKEPQGKVVWEITAQDKTIVSSFYKKDDKTRIDSSMGSIESRTFMIGTKITSCSKVNDAWTCFEIPEIKEAPSTGKVNINYTEIEEDKSKGEIKKDGSMQIAGTTANCWKITEFAKNQEARYCFAKNGFMLYMKTTTEEGTYEMKAKEYSETVLDSEFTLPAAPTKGMEEALKYAQKVNGAADSQNAPTQTDSANTQSAQAPSAGSVDMSCVQGCNSLEGQAKIDCVTACI